MNFEQSDNVTHLLVIGFTGSNGLDLDTDDDGNLDITPWSSVVDVVSLIKEGNPPSSTEFSYAGVLGGDGVGPDGSNTPSHIFRDAMGDWQIGESDVAVGSDSPGAANVSAVPEPSAFVLLFAIGSVTFSGRRIVKWVGRRRQA